ncbi:MAG: endolytic transglycosylase MltG [Bacilli bacterium]|nr:endolytic transglycosylase MltG [Bacilli bacterium]MDD4733783.1 endolytic transglycosylase MltG [Bacilli bacterium]
MKKILLFLGLIIIVLSLIIFIYINSMLKPVSNDNTKIEFEVSDKMAYLSLSSSLYEKKLIKSELIYKIYVKIKKPTKLQAGIYYLSQSMNLEEIIETFEKGTKDVANTVMITFPEGINMRRIAKIISTKTDNTYEDVIKVATDKEYIKTLIPKYWFLTDSILNKEIYYPLEGYLFPNTYQILSEYDSKQIFEIMLNQLDKELTKYKAEIEDSKYNVHQMLTLSSIIELESKSKLDRKGVAGVFYNRLNIKMTLGSDVTTYYGSKIDDFSQRLLDIQLYDCSNGYNTRCSSLSGLPVGPIANSSIESLEAAIKPEKNDYLYFLADCSGKVYYNKKYNEHLNKKNQLIREGNWCA